MSQTVGLGIHSFTVLTVLLFQAYFVFKTISTHLGYISMHSIYMENVYPENHVNFNL